MAVTKEIKLIVRGLGLIFYSDNAVKDIPTGEDYLSSHYWKGEDVLKHTYEGSIVGINTCSSGEYILEISQDVEDISVHDEINYDYKLGVGVIVDSGRLYFRDLYDLMQWDKNCPEEQIIEIDNGYYEVYIYSSIPLEGFRGEDQKIILVFKKAMSTG